jgi:hypothetical protein
VVLAVAVAQHESWGSERHERADDAGCSILQHHAAAGDDDGIVAFARARGVRVERVGQHPGGVVAHRSET